MRMKICRFCWGLSLCLLCSSPLMAAITEEDAGLDPLDEAVVFFQTYISPADGPRCQMMPTCSSYSRQALHKHGMWMGMFMTVDRLLREVDPLEHRQPIISGGALRYADPLSANDFWLHPPASSSPGADPADP